MIIDVLIGTIVGIITGIIPGIHPNLIATIATTHLSNTRITQFVISAALAHTVSSAIPLVYLSTPTPENAVALQPIASLNKRGFAHEAIKLLCIGSITSIIIAAILTPAFIIIIPKIKQTLQPFRTHLLIATVIFLILYERTITKKVYALLILTISGILGMITLNSAIQEPLFPLFTGLFGIPALLMNTTTQKITKQHTTDFIRPKTKQLATILLGSIFSTIFLTIIPAIALSQATILTTLFLKIKKYNYITLLGSATILDYYFSLLFAALFSKTRNGVFEIIGTNQFSTTNIFQIICIMIFATSTSTLITLTLAKHVAKAITHIQTKTLSISIIIFLITMTYIISGFPGIIVLINSSITGILPLLLNTSRTHLMGCLIVPIIKNITLTNNKV